MGRGRPNDLAQGPELLLELAMGHPAVLEHEAWNQIDAEHFLTLAARQQVDALCHWQLRRLGRDGSRPHGLVPSEIRTGLKHAFVHHTMRNEALGRDLEHLDGCLRAANVDALVFKGPWLAHAAYPSPGTRPIDDIDLGVREHDYRKALDALRVAGYRPLSPVPDLAEEALHRAHFREQLRFVASGRRGVELHFRMINVGPPAEEAWVWDERRRLVVGGASIQVPGAEAMLLHLALHANQHGFAVLRLLFDLRFALDQDGPQLDERRFLERVSRLRCRASIFHALELAGVLAGANAPSSLVEGLRPRELRRWIFSRLWSLDRVRHLASVQASNAMEAARLYLLEMGSPLDKLRYLRGMSRAAGGVRPLMTQALQVLRGREAPRP